MPHVNSADGTSIGYDRLSDTGPPVVLVGGGLDDGTENHPLGEYLADNFAVVNYRRRGRGDSGDTQPYALAREVEDLAAVIDAAGGRAHLFGASTGGALALEAAAAGLPVDRIAVHEVPYQVDDAMVAAWQAYRLELNAALDAGDRDEALTAVHAPSRILRAGHRWSAGSTGVARAACSWHRRCPTTRRAWATARPPHTVWRWCGSRCS